MRILHNYLTFASTYFDIFVIAEYFWKDYNELVNKLTSANVSKCFIY